jgi:uncharacterized protein (TIGR02996 family)
MAGKRVASVEKGLLADVIEHPADDVPRLVYADWLEENGDRDRAEFIRVQIEQAGLGPGAARGVDMEQRARTLLELHGERWRQDLPEGVGKVWFRRGFVAHLSTTVPQFLRQGAAWRKALPLESLYLWDARGQLHDLAASPLLAGLRGLGFTGDRKLGPADLAALGRSSFSASLRRLDLSSMAIGNRGVQALAKAPHLTSLESLSLAHCFQLFATTGPDALDLCPLLGSPHRDRLKALNLSCNGMTSESWAALGGFPSLSALMLSGVFPRETERFARSLRGSSLRLLEVFNGSGRIEWVRALAGSSALSELLALELTSLGCTDKTAEAIAGSAALGNLRELNLRVNRLTDAGVEALARSPLMPRLELLNLCANKVGDAGARALAASPHLRSLRRLDLIGNRIGAAGRAALRERFGACVCLDEDDLPTTWDSARLRRWFAEHGMPC